MDLGAVNPSTFEAHRGTTFRVALTDEPLELRLTAVDRLPAVPHAPRPEPFSLVFSGPSERALDQRSYRLEHAELGDLEIFLVPTGFDADGRLLYEAVFN